MIGGSMFPAIGSLPYVLTLPPYGFFWFALAAEAQLPVWHVPAPEALPDYATLVVRKDIDELLVGASRTKLEEGILPGYLQKRRWFGAKDGKAPQVRIALATELPRDGRPMMLVEIETHAAKAGSKIDRYQLPFGFYGEDESVSALPQQLAMARVRRGRQVGYLTDAFALGEFAHQIVKLLSDAARVPTAEGMLVFEPTTLLTALMPLLTSGEGGGVRWLSAEQSNSSSCAASPPASIPKPRSRAS
jgi:maltose alpha-D-glucosyltransferase/alpha-amylase